LSQHVAWSRLTSNIKIILKIKFTSGIFADITRSLVVVLQHFRFCKKILILIFFSDLFSVECKFFCPNSAVNTMGNRAISLVESSRDNSLISCQTSSHSSTSHDKRKHKIFIQLNIDLCMGRSYEMRHINNNNDYSAIGNFLSKWYFITFMIWFGPYWQYGRIHDITLNLKRVKNDTQRWLCTLNRQVTT
jgi:hypothetical protein